MPDRDTIVFDGILRRFDLALYHLRRVTEICKIVTALIAECQRERGGFAASTRTTCPLGVVCRHWRHIPHEHSFKTSDVNAHFKCGRTTENINFFLLELFLIVICRFAVELRGMFNYTKIAYFHLAVQAVVMVVSKFLCGIYFNKFSVTVISWADILHIVAGKPIAFLANIPVFRDKKTDF